MQLPRKVADDDKVHDLLHDENVQLVIQNRVFQLEEAEKVFVVGYLNVV